MTRARNSANLASHGNLFVDITNDRTGIGSVVPAQSLHVAGTAGFHADTTFTGDLYNATWDRSDNSLKFVDNARLKFGDSNDLHIYHSGSASVIREQGTGDLKITAQDLVLQNVTNGNTMGQFVAGGAVKLHHDGSNKFQTTAYGTNTTGTAVNDGLVVAGVATVTTMNVTGVLTYDDVTSVDSVGIVTARQGVRVTADGSNSANYISVGAGNDLQLFHNGTNSHIRNNTGTLVLNADSLLLQSLSESYLSATANGAVELYHNNLKKFETTSSGATVTGTLTATSFSGSGASLTDVGFDPDAQGNLVAGTNAGANFSGTDANNNILLGYEAGNALTTADNNVAIGYEALKSADTEGNNVAVGYRALKEMTSMGSNVAVGYEAGYYTYSLYNCVAVGFQAMSKPTQGSFNTWYSVAVGSGAMGACGGDKCVAIGYEALDGSNAYNSDEHTAVGYQSLTNVTAHAQQNTALGALSGKATTSGDKNIYIGYNAGNNAHATGDNCVIIGSNSAASSTSVSNEITLGDTNITKLRIPGLNYVNDAGKVGINETSPDALLHLKNISAAGVVAGIKFESSGTSNNAGDTIGQLEFEHNDANDAGVSATIKCVAEDTAGNTYLTFNNGNPGSVGERLRITSTGAINCGHGAAVNLHGSTTTGINLNANNNSGQIVANASGNRALIIGRQASYGQVIEFFQGSTGNQAGITIPALNTFGIETGATERLRIDSSGRLIIGHTASIGDFHGPYGTTNRNPQFQINGTNVTQASMSITSWDNNVVGYYGPAIFLAKSGSSTKGTNSRVTNINSILGSIIFSGDDGTDFVKGAMIQAAVDTSTGDNDMPARLQFLTTPDGAQEPIERLRITSAGVLKFNQADSIIHTSADTSRLRLFGGSSNSVNNGAALTLQGVNESGGNYADLASGTGGYVRFRTGTTERLRISSAGNVSIHSAAYGGGGAAPQLYVRGTGGRQVKIHNSNAGTSSLQITNATTGEGEDAGTQLFTQGSTGDFFIQNAFATGDIAFGTRPSGGSTTERLRIDSNGKFCFGTYNSGYANNDSVANFVNAASAGTENPLITLWNPTTVGDARASIDFLTNNNSGTGRDGAFIRASNDGVTAKAHLQFGTIKDETYAETVRIASDGKVGINEAGNINGRLHVQHDALAENILFATRYNDQSNDKPILAITEAQMTGVADSGLIIGTHNRPVHIGAVFDANGAVTTGSTAGMTLLANGNLTFAQQAMTVLVSATDESTINSGDNDDPIHFDTTYVNKGGMSVSQTKSRITVPVSGTYLITACVSGSVTAESQGDGIQLAILKNGSYQFAGSGDDTWPIETFGTENGMEYSFTLSLPVTASTSDYFELTFLNIGAAVGTVTRGYFSVTKIH